MMHRFLAWVLGSQGLVVSSALDMLSLMSCDQGEIPSIKCILSLRKNLVGKQTGDQGWAGGLPYETAPCGHIFKGREAISFLKLRPPGYPECIKSTNDPILIGTSQVAPVVKKPTYRRSRHKDAGSINQVGRDPWRRKSTPLQYSGLEVHGVARRWT